METANRSMRVEGATSPTLSDGEVATVRRRPMLVLIPMRDCSHVVLTWHYRAAIGRASWELPASRLGHDESLNDAAVRSCLEHFGLMPGCVQHLCGLHPVPKCCDEEIIFCRVVTDVSWVMHEPPTQ